jgi:hypothetical protein
MNPDLTSALSEFNKKSEFSKSGLAAELASEPPLHRSELSLITRARLQLGKLIPLAFVRFLVIFFWCCRHAGLAVLWCHSQRGDGELVSTTCMAGAAARTR